MSVDVFFLKFSPLETGRCTRTSLGSGVELCRFEALRVLRPAFGGFSSSFSGGFHKWQSPKWLVYDGKSQSKLDDLRVPFLIPPFQETSIFCASRLTAPPCRTSRCITVTQPPRCHTAAGCMSCICLCTYGPIWRNYAAQQLVAASEFVQKWGIPTKWEFVAWLFS